MVDAHLCFRGMLSAAHILAMDAKNLLDVIDSIRIRFPYVDSQICQRHHEMTNSRSSGQECRMRSSQSGETLLRRSQSSERQSCGFRQSQSGDLLHRMGQSIDRGSQVDIPRRLNTHYLPCCAEYWTHLALEMPSFVILFKFLMLN